MMKKMMKKVTRVYCSKAVMAFVICLFQLSSASGGIKLGSANHNGERRTFLMTPGSNAITSHKGRETREMMNCCYSMRQDGYYLTLQDRNTRTTWTLAFTNAIDAELFKARYDNAKNTELAAKDATKPKPAKKQSKKQSDAKREPVTLITTAEEPAIENGEFGIPLGKAKKEGDDHGFGALAALNKLIPKERMFYLREDFTIPYHDEDNVFKGEIPSNYILDLKTQDAATVEFKPVMETGVDKRIFKLSEFENKGLFLQRYFAGRIKLYKKLRNTCIKWIESELSDSELNITDENEADQDVVIEEYGRKFSQHRRDPTLNPALNAFVKTVHESGLAYSFSFGVMQGMYSIAIHAGGLKFNHHAGTCEWNSAWLSDSDTHGMHPLLAGMPEL